LIKNKGVSKEAGNMMDGKSITGFPAEPEAQEDLTGFFSALNAVLAREDIIAITHDMQIGVGQYTPIEVYLEE
jgi:hypothetical protein